jgi:hypothetical protein
MAFSALDLDSASKSIRELYRSIQDDLSQFGLQMSQLRNRLLSEHQVSEFRNFSTVESHINKVHLTLFLLYIDDKFRQKLSPIAKQRHLDAMTDSTKKMLAVSEADILADEPLQISFPTDYVMLSTKDIDLPFLFAPESSMTRTILNMENGSNPINTVNIISGSAAEESSTNTTPCQNTVAVGSQSLSSSSSVVHNSEPATIEREEESAISSSNTASQVTDSNSNNISQAAENADDSPSRKRQRTEAPAEL